MTYEKKNSENNALCGIAFGFDETAMVIFGEGNYGRFSTSKFVVEITTFDTTGKAIARENVYMLSRVGNQFTVGIRAYEPVPIDDDQTTNIQQALPFVKTNTVMKQVFSKKFADDLQDETIRLENEKLNITDFQKQTAIYGASSTGTDAYAITLNPVPSALSDLKGGIYFLADVGNSGPATLNINGLGAKTIKKKNDQDLNDGDIEANQKVEIVYNSVDNVFEMVSQEASVINVVVGNLQNQNLIAGENMSAGQPFRIGLSGVAYADDYTINTGNSGRTTNASSLFTFIGKKTRLDDIRIWIVTNANTTTGNVTLTIHDGATLVATSNIVAYTTSLNNTQVTWSFAGGFTMTVGVTYTVKINFSNILQLMFQNFTVRKLNYTILEDVTKVYKANSSISLFKNVIGITVGSVNSGATFTGNILGYQAGYSGFIGGLMLYLRDDGSFSHYPGTYLRKVGFAASSTEMYFNPNIYQEAETYITLAKDTNIKLQSDTEVSTVSSSLVKGKEISIGNYHNGGTITVEHTMRTTATTSSESRIYKNGVAVGTLRIQTTIGTFNYTEDIAVTQGDLIQLYYRNANTNTVYVSNFRLKYKDVFDQANITSRGTLGSVII